VDWLRVLTVAGAIGTAIAGIAAGAAVVMQLSKRVKDYRHTGRWLWRTPIRQRERIIAELAKLRDVESSSLDPNRPTKREQKKGDADAS
jgi:hypothetical protein